MLERMNTYWIRSRFQIVRSNLLLAVAAGVLVVAACDGDSPTQPPQNQTPTATFTSSCTVLDCTFNGSGSSDSDGTIGSYAWDFGDSGTGTGQSATHSYSAAGSFTVMLTVTDDKGATGTTSQSVTPAAVSGISQLGLNIVGEASGDAFGRSVALSDDGTRVVSGARQNAGGGSNSGHVRAFDWNGSAWVQVGQDLDGVMNEFIGEDRTVDISGDGSRIVIGSFRFNSGFGKATIFELSGGSWVVVDSPITSSDQAAFGTSVSLSTDGSRVAVGARNGDGRVEVHEFVGTAWTQVGSSIAGPVGGTFGHDVALSGDGSRFVGGAPNAPGTDGQLLAYDWNGSAWTQVGGTMQGVETFGMNVAMSSDGQRVAGLASFDGDYAAVYELVGGAWVQMGADFQVLGAFESYQNLGFSATGDRFALGTTAAGSNGQGTVEIYDWDGSSWDRVGMEVLGDHTVAQLGWSVSMAADGSRVAVGMPSFNDPTIGSLSGAVKVFAIN